MYYFSDRSIKNLATCNQGIKDILYLAIQEIDFTVLCGFRNKKEQNKAYNTGHSQLKFPESKHNFFPSNAVDLAPYPIDWENIDRFKNLAKVVKRCAEELNIKIAWGGDWKIFKDYPHFELQIFDEK